MFLIDKHQQNKQYPSTHTMSLFSTSNHVLTTRSAKWAMANLGKQIVPSLVKACNGDLLAAIRAERNSVLSLSKVPQHSWSESLHRYKSTLLLLAEQKEDVRIPTSHVPPDVRRLWHAHLSHGSNCGRIEQTCLRFWERHNGRWRKPRTGTPLGPAAPAMQV